jgi:hypothetical protein
MICLRPLKHWGRVCVVLYVGIGLAKGRSPAQGVLPTVYTYLRSWALLEKPPIVQPLKNFPAFNGTRRFITVFTRALHWSLFWARSIQSTPSHCTSLKSPPLVPILSQIDPVHAIPLYLSNIYFNIVSIFLVVSFLLASPSISYMHSSSPHSCYMPCPSHPLLIYVWRGVRVMKLLIMQFSPISCHFISLRTKYSPQHPVHKHPQSMILP